MTALQRWTRYQDWLCDVPGAGLRLDISRMNFPPDFVERMTPAMSRALDAMRDIEAGALANASEGRQVGHYWLRAAHLAPTPAIRADIESTLGAVEAFASEVREGRVAPAVGTAGKFTRFFVIGIGGSALGPQLLGEALRAPSVYLPSPFLDNTDPESIQRFFHEIEDELESTLALVISKSGGTIETRNAMLEAQHAYAARGLNFARHAVAITAAGSALDHQARAQNWLRTFPMWDWVGGRTSITSAVGLLPAALLGVDIRAFLAGAASCDQATRDPDIRRNPAALLALMWHYAGNGSGDRAMVVLPYCDRLALLGRYLQQLVMESLGKGRTRSGAPVEQGLTVFGNKGSTDQHAYVQQLREGRSDFFVTFVGVDDPGAAGVEVEQGAHSADYLFGFRLGTREALSEAGRESVTLTMPRLDAFQLGSLIALFERTVGLYAELIDVNAYDQPGVEAGKRAAGRVIELQRLVLAHLVAHPGKSFTAGELARTLDEQDVEVVFHVLAHLVARADSNILAAQAADPAQIRFRYEPPA